MAKQNIPLLKRLRTRFLRMRHNKHFDMSVVAKKTDCGTAMCIAGHTLDLQGYKRRFKMADCGPGCCGIQADFISPSGRKVHPLKAAARELGLAYHDTAYNLFHDYSILTPKQAAKAIDKLIQRTNAARSLGRVQPL